MWATSHSFLCGKISEIKAPYWSFLSPITPTQSNLRFSQDDRRTISTAAWFAVCSTASRRPQIATSPASRTDRTIERSQFKARIDLHTKKFLHNLGPVAVAPRPVDREAGRSSDEQPEHGGGDRVGVLVVGDGGVAASRDVDVSPVSVSSVRDRFRGRRHPLLHGRRHHARPRKLHTRSRRWAIQRSQKIGLECESPSLFSFAFNFCTFFVKFRNGFSQLRISSQISYMIFEKLQSFQFNF